MRRRNDKIKEICQKYSDSTDSRSGTLHEIINLAAPPFYSKEHEPLHIHVEGNGGMAKFIWNGVEFELFEKQGIKANDYKKIKKMIDENADIIVKR